VRQASGVDASVRLCDENNDLHRFWITEPDDTRTTIDVEWTAGGENAVRNSGLVAYFAQHARYVVFDLITPTYQ